MCFVDGGVKVPAVALINWDDDFIHSSDDDLAKIDQTQLQRNNFIIGSIAYFLAFKAEPGSVPLISGETFAQGARRLANDLNVAMRVLRESSEAPDQRWKLASMIVEQGTIREASALQSIRVFAGGDQKASQIIDQMIARVKSKEPELMKDLQDYARQISGADPRPVQLSAEEAAASRKIPANVATLATYFDRRGEVDFDTNLHGLMRSEVFNFVDGRRSYYDIYKAVNAEAMAAGSWYYGTVTLRDVVGLLDAAVQSKALTLK
jgi:hypothetical protein